MENIKINVSQINKSRFYKVFLNGKEIGKIQNKPKYHNKYISSLLLTNAFNLMTELNLKPKSFTLKSEFIGEINHVKNL